MGKGVAGFFLAVLVIVSGVTGSASANSVDYKNVSIKLEKMWVTASSAYFPVVLRVSNSGPARTLGVQVKTSYGGESPVIAKESFTLDANSEVILEVPALISTNSSGYIHFGISFELDGENVPHSIDSSDNRSYDVPTFVFYSDDDLSFRKAMQKDPSWQNKVGINDCPVEHACRRWQSYVGLRGVVVVDRKSVGKMLPVQRQALTNWVRSSGGIVWIADKNSAEVARQLGFSSIDDSDNPSQQKKINTVNCCMGRLWLSSKLAVENTSSTAMASSYKHSTSILLGTYRNPSRGGNRYYHRYGANEPRFPSFVYTLLNGLNKIPVLGYCILSVVLGAIIGPLNFLYLRKKNRTSWFYFTAPALAFIGVGGLAAYSVSSEGLGMKYNEFAVLAVDESSAEGAIYQARGIYSGLSVGKMTYPSRSVATAFSTDDARGEFTYSPGSQFTLEGGWIMPRSPSGLLTMTLVTARMGLRVREEGGEIYVYNGFNHNVIRCYFKNDKREIFTVDQIPAGQERKLVNYHRDSLRADKRPELFYKQNMENWTLMAQMESLPYLENGAQEGTLLSGVYWYMLLGK